MNILCTDTFQEQIKDILEGFVKEDFRDTKEFKMYLDTVIINMPTKVNKFKKSIYFDDDNIKDIEHKGFVIPFFIDTNSNTYVVLGIVKK